MWNMSLNFLGRNGHLKFACVFRSDQEPPTPCGDTVHLRVLCFFSIQQTLSGAPLCPGCGWLSPEISSAMSVNPVFKRNPWQGQGLIVRGKPWLGVKVGSGRESHLKRCFSLCQAPQMLGGIQGGGPQGFLGQNEAGLLALSNIWRRQKGAKHLFWNQRIGYSMDWGCI